MKAKFLIPIVVMIGFAALFFFPEPETNFLAYAGTALLFIILVVILLIRQRRNG
jgi:hypothetical protein